MLITMLLLISVLILTSAMLMHYALEGKGGAEGTDKFSFAKLLEKGKSISTQLATNQQQEVRQDEPVTAAATPTPTETKSTRFGFNRFFGGGGPKSVRWPKLKLTGFGQSADGEGGFAILGGKHVMEGSEIGGVRVVEIRTHGVVVEYKGEQKTLSLELSR